MISDCVPPNSPKVCKATSLLASVFVCTQNDYWLPDNGLQSVSHWWWSLHREKFNFNKWMFIIDYIWKFSCSLECFVEYLLVRVLLRITAYLELDQITFQQMTKQSIIKINCLHWNRWCCLAGSKITTLTLITIFKQKTVNKDRKKPNQKSK